MLNTLLCANHCFQDLREDLLKQMKQYVDEQFANFKAYCDKVYFILIRTFAHSSIQNHNQTSKEESKEATKASANASNQNSAGNMVFDDSLLRTVVEGSEYEEIRTAILSVEDASQLRTAIENAASGDLRTAIEANNVDQLRTAVELGADEQWHTTVENHPGHAGGQA